MAIDLRKNALSPNASFIRDADALLNLSISRERQRYNAILQDVSRLKEDVQSGSIFDAIGGIGDLAAKAAKNLGLGPKAVGPVSELPLTQQISQNTELRFVKTRFEHKKEVTDALKKTAMKSSFGFFRPGATSKSLGIGKIDQYADDVQNKYGPSESGMLTYRNSPDLDPTDLANKFFPFKIEYVATGQYEIFPAYIGNINEQLSVSWNEKKYLGRSEPINLYDSTSRSFSMGIVLFAAVEELSQQIGPVIEPLIQTGSNNSNLVSVNGLPNGFQIPVSNQSEGLRLVNNAITKTDLWRMISFLESACYPVYDADDRYAAAPFLKINLGHVWEEQLIVITSINIAYEPLVWDLNGQYFTPMFASINISAKIIHESSPGILGDGRFGFKGDNSEFRFLHRSDFS